MWAAVLEQANHTVILGSPDCLESMPTTSLSMLSKHCLPLASGHVVIQRGGWGREGCVHKTENVCVEFSLAARAQLICRFFKLELLPVLQSFWSFASRQFVDGSHLSTTSSCIGDQETPPQQPWF